MQLYLMFHLNLAYSSIEEEEWPEVIRKCYWPLLRLTRNLDIPLGIEASGYTLETAAAIDPGWIEEFRRLTRHGPAEFIGSGYAQIIGPLVPSEVNRINLALGNQIYERFLGFLPQIALVNEQAYSAGLIPHYLEAGYRAIIMEWDNPARFHPEWNSSWRYLPQRACGRQGEAIPIIWNKSIAFQKFQRYAHGEIEISEYLDYLNRHRGEAPRVFPLYGNDAEIFDFRPHRYSTEPYIEEGEWQRIESLLRLLRGDPDFSFIRPSQVLNLLEVPGAGNRLRLESPEQPVPVKKQNKYNINRWAVAGRDNPKINTECWKVYRALRRNPKAPAETWKELCYLWSSDFRTHITDRRWETFLARLGKMKRAAGEDLGGRDSSWGSRIPGDALPTDIKMIREKKNLVFETDLLKISLNCQRGLAVDSLIFKEVVERPLIGTLPHGFFDAIEWGADYYTGHLILEIPGGPKVTDLNRVDPEIGWEPDRKILNVAGNIGTPLGPIRKSILVELDGGVHIAYALEWPELPSGSLRLGHVTLNPFAFDSSRLYFAAANGGPCVERFLCSGRKIEHGRPVSFLVSASEALGMTEGRLEMGDPSCRVVIQTDPSAGSLVAQITFVPVGPHYFFRAAFSASELDDTVPGYAHPRSALKYAIRISAERGELEKSV
jgi:hypothetical protein